MATNTHIQRGAPRRTATTLLLAMAIGVGALAGRTALPTQISNAATPSNSAATGLSMSNGSYGWPVKPFDRQHPVRGSFADPRSIFAGNPTLRGLMTSRCACSYHQGIDIAAPDGTDVYPVRSGVVRIVTPDWVEIESGNGNAFQYWHIHPVVKVGQEVEARQTILGRILRGSEHVHLTELQDGKATNPLAPGHIAPYVDSTVPRVQAISFRRGDRGAGLLPEYLSGRVEIVANAADTPAIPVPGKWNGLPITPAKLTYRIETFPMREVVLAETTAMDVTRMLPNTSDLWRTYARGTHMNMVQMGTHRYWYQPGVYLFKLAAEFDTHRLKDGVYQIIVTAWDTAGNHSSTQQIVNVHNRKSWLAG
jgi:murein DD-endopeptidase MepM/ murein hydrolase activator NlpD